MPSRQVYNIQEENQGLLKPEQSRLDLYKAYKAFDVP